MKEKQRQAIEADWRAWLTALFAGYVSAGFGAHHEQHWSWVWSLVPGKRPQPLVEILPRGGGKSTNAELTAVSVAARRIRPYALYVCGTQERADDHVGNVAGMMESRTFAAAYPDAANRALGKYGNVKGWRRNRLRTASGFTIDAIGLDTAARGAKVDEDRPGLIIIDDIDEGLDTEQTTQKKIHTLTHAILPAGAPDMAVLAVQNLIHANSIFSMLADGRADFLADRLVIGPYPAIYDLTYTVEGGRALLTGGTPLWAGQDLARCQQLVDDIGLRAFLTESQQDVTRDPEGALWQRAWIDAHRRGPDMVPALARLVVAVDPTGSAGGDEAGIVVAALGTDKHLYVLADESGHGSPDEWARRAIVAYDTRDADRLVYEANFGGEMVASTITLTAQHMKRAEGWAGSVPALKEVRASRGKLVRAEPIAALYEQGRVHHVGTFVDMENEMCRWVPGDDSPNRMDALVWALTELAPEAIIPHVAPPAGLTTRSKWRGIGEPPAVGADSADGPVRRAEPRATTGQAQPFGQHSGGGNGGGSLSVPLARPSKWRI